MLNGPRKPLFLPSAMNPSSTVIEMFLNGEEIQAAEMYRKELSEIGLGTLRDLIKQDVSANYVDTQFADTLTPEEAGMSLLTAVKSVRERLGLDLVTAKDFVVRARNKA